MRAPYPWLDPVSEATREAMCAAALEVNDRYMGEFIEGYGFCPYARRGRTSGQTRRYVYYADTDSVDGLLEIMVRVATDPQQAVAQVIVPAVDVGPREWVKFCHALTAAGHAAMGGAEVLATAPLHPELPFRDDTPLSLVPLFRRAPDPTIQWVRLDAIEKLYRGRGSDSVYIDLAEALIHGVSLRPPLYERICETNAAMARRLTIDGVVAQLAEIAEWGARKYGQILLDEIGTGKGTSRAPSTPRAGLGPGCPRHADAAGGEGVVPPESIPIPVGDSSADAWVEVARWSELEPGTVRGVRVGDVDLVLTRDGDEVRALYGRCPHRHALLAGSRVEGGTLECRRHGWDFDVRTGVSRCVPGESLATFAARVDLTDDAVLIDAGEVRAWLQAHPDVADHAELDDE